MTTAARGAPLLVLALAALATPLVVLPEAFLHPFVASKALFLRPLAWTCAALLAWEALAARRLPRPGAIGWAGLAFLAVAAVSAAAGVDPALSFWDSGERMIGVLTLAAVAVVFAAVLRAGADDRAWTVLFRVSLAVSCLVSAGALLQALGVVGMGPHPRASSTLGSPAYLGALGLHALFLGALQIARAPGRLDRGLAWTSMAAGGASIVLSEARAALAGLALGGVYAAFRAIRDGSPRVRRAVAACTVAGAALAAAAYLLRDTAIVRDAPLARRLVAFDARDSTLSTRLMAWDAALDAARDRPVLGWGPNAFPHAFAAHYRPEFLRYGHDESFFDDAHGILFGTLAEQGLAGVAAAAALYGAAFVAIGRARAAGGLGASGGAAAGGYVAAHLGNLIFSFEDISSLVNLALVLAFCERAGAGASSERAPPRLAAGPRAAAALLVGAAAIAWTLHADVRAALANARTRDALDALPDAARAEEHVRSALALGSPHADTDTLSYAWYALGAAKSLAGDAPARADALGRGAFELLGAVPRRARPDLHRTLLRAALAEATPSLRTDESVARDLRAEIRRAIDAAPRRQDLRFALAALELRHGRAPEAAAAVEAVVRDDPWGGEGWARLAAVYRAAGRPDEARRIVREARERGVRFREADAKLVEGL